MSYTAGQVMDDAAAALNDFNKSLYTYDVQLPYLKMANRDLDQSLQLIGHPITMMNEAIIPVLAGAVELTLPASFFLPISLAERKPGTTESFTDMTQTRFASGTQGSSLGVWDFRHNCINFVGATQDREVKLSYWRTLPEIQSDASQLFVNGGRNYLAFRTAAMCAAFIGQNELQASILNNEAGAAIDKLESLFIKNRQVHRVRRRRFRR